MLDDLKELLSVFNDPGVRYLIVGGYAVSLRVEPRATKRPLLQLCRTYALIRREVSTTRKRAR